VAVNLLGAQAAVPANSANRIDVDTHDGWRAWQLALPAFSFQLFLRLSPRSFFSQLGKLVALSPVVLNFVYFRQKDVTFLL
tara:strand:+ start:1945 stop:2187 length:243 start_codon:yes stop_codon:yes gene_type:complete